MWSGLIVGIGSFSMVGGSAGVVGVLDLENAPDFAMNSASAAIPFWVPRISGRVKSLETFLSSLRSSL